MNKVNVLLCPYSYVLSPYIRKLLGLDIKNSIIVFDEAHNIENNAESSCSLELLKTDLDFTKNIKFNDKRTLKFL